MGEDAAAKLAWASRGRLELSIAIQRQMTLPSVNRRSARCFWWSIFARSWEHSRLDETRRRSAESFASRCNFWAASVSRTKRFSSVFSRPSRVFSKLEKGWAPAGRSRSEEILADKG